MITWTVQYSTPFGVQYRSLRADSAVLAAQLGKLRTPYKKGWVYEGVSERAAKETTMERA